MHAACGVHGGEEKYCLLQGERGIWVGLCKVRAVVGGCVAVVIKEDVRGVEVSRGGLLVCLCCVCENVYTPLP